jgi:ATP-dependent metalloprotease
VPLPDVKGRREIIDLYLSRVIVSKDVDSELLARATPGFSGAQLEALINSAALMAAQRGADQIEMLDIEEARDKQIMGPAKKSRVKKAEQMRLTAYHEGGHTLTALLTKGAHDLHKVTILPRGFSGGATYSLPKDDELETKAQILAEIDVAMGGRAAEELIYGLDKVTTGAGMDMRQASELARRYCMYYSMSDLGLSSYMDTEPSPEKKAAIDAEVEHLLQESYARVRALLTAHKRDLDRLAAALVRAMSPHCDRAIPSLCVCVCACGAGGDLGALCREWHRIAWTAAGAGTLGRVRGRARACSSLRRAVGV